MKENKTFCSEASYLVWELFKKTGNIAYYMLYSAIENKESQKEIELEK